MLNITYITAIPHFLGYLRTLILLCNWERIQIGSNQNLIAKKNLATKGETKTIKECPTTKDQQLKTKDQRPKTNAQRLTTNKPKTNE